MFKLYLAALKQYATFSGRAASKEYFAFVIPTLIIALILEFVPVVGGRLVLLFGIAMFLPLYAVITRRLHDFGASGWWAIGVWICTFLLRMAVNSIWHAVSRGGTDFSEALIIVGVLYIIQIGIFIGIGLLPADKGTNKYGAPSIR